MDKILKTDKSFVVFTIEKRENIEREITVTIMYIK